MSTIPYNRWNCVLSNSTKAIYSLPNNLTFKIENYVKSQMHFPLVCYKDGRDIDDYYKAMSVVENGTDDVESLESFYKVLKYFYEDIAESINNSSHEVSDSEFNFFVDSDLYDLPREAFTVNTDSEIIWRIKVQKLLELSSVSAKPVLIEMR